MKILICLALMASGAAAAAKDDWLCTEEASQAQDGLVLSCGVAQGRDENEARAKAFDNAKAEYERVCEASDACRGRKSSVEPRRNSCSAEGDGYKCYRLLAFHLRELNDPLGNEGRATASVSSEAVNPDSLRATAEATALAGPRIRKAMSKADVLATLGAPQTVEPSDYVPGRAYLHYRGQPCLVENSECSVILEKDAVQGFANFKPSVAEEVP